MIRIAASQTLMSLRVERAIDKAFDLKVGRSACLTREKTSTDRRSRPAL